LVKAFANGCTAMTGVEAISNGVPVFRELNVKNARKTLTIIIAILMLMLLGIAYLCRSYGIGATPPDQPGYQSLLSQLTGAVSGRNMFYYVTMGTVLAVLTLSANTSFADFPRVCRSFAEKEYLPYPFMILGRRLVFSIGICALALLAGLLLILFGGITDRLIPLFAVGAFSAFTLSQAGMVMHWKSRGGQRGARRNMVINGVGAVATGLTTCVVIVAKFADGSLRVAEPDAPEASPEAGWPQCCQPIHLTIRWANTTDVSAFLCDSINRLRRGQLDPRVADAMGYLTSVLLRSLEQGPIEERLAKIEANLAANAPEGNGAKRI
jgi:amino acid transporter